MQNKMSVDNLNTCFKLLIQKAGLNIATNADILIYLYKSAINWEIVKQIILSNPPDNLNDWMKKALELDNAYKWANKPFANAISGSSRKPFKPQFNPQISQRHDQGEPMDINCLNPRE